MSRYRLQELGFRERRQGAPPRIAAIVALGCSPILACARSYSRAHWAMSFCNSCMTAMALIVLHLLASAECARVPFTVMRAQITPMLAVAMRIPVGSASNAKSAVTPCVTRWRVPMP